MFCPKCGRPYEEGMRFCEHCGNPLPQPSVGGYAPQAGIPQSEGPMESSSSNPVLNLLRQLAKSPLYLTGAIAYSCMILFQLISAMTSNSMMGVVDQCLNFILQYGNMDMDATGMMLERLNDIIPMMRGASLGSALIGQIPNILIAIGIWLVFASAVNRSGGPMKTTGLTLIKVIAVIQLVLVSLLALLVVVVLFILMAALAGYDDSVVPIFLVLVAVMIGFFALAILFYVKLIGTIKAMQISILIGQPSDRVSVYVAVISILSGVCSIPGLLGAWGLSNVVAIVAEIVAAFSYGIFLFKYRSAMHEMPPVYHGPIQDYPTPQTLYCDTKSNKAQPDCPIQDSVWQPSQPEKEQERQERTTTPISTPSPFVPETTVLNAPAKQVNLQITRVRDGSCVQIVQPRFRIGRDPAAVDYIITDNTAVGRQHADILIHDDACTVMDLNSTNHTYLNGQQLTPNVEYPLQNGDELILGDEAFRVSIS